MLASVQAIVGFAHRVINKLLIIEAFKLELECFPFIIQVNYCINEFKQVENYYLIHAINDVSYIKYAGIVLLQSEF
jgi:hypothetical protein